MFCITETWLLEEIPSSLFLTKDYDSVRYDRKSRGGGVIKTSIPNRTVLVPDNFRHIELVCVDIELNHKSYRIVTYYRPGGFGAEAEIYMVDSINCFKALYSPIRIQCAWLETLICQ